MGNVRRTMYVLAAIILGLFVLSVAGLNSAQAGNSEGNTAANISNNGLAVAQDGFIYYLDQVGDIYAGGNEKVHKMEAQAMSPLLLGDDEAWDLNISGEWLYYSNWSDRHRLYKMRTDGSEKTSIGDDPVSNLSLAGDWAIYVKWTNTTGGGDNNIYKVSLAPGKQLPIRLNNDATENLNVTGGWLFYVNASDGHKPYKIRPDGTGRTQITADPVIFMVAADGWLYYSNFADGGKLYKVAADGTGRTKLSDDKPGFINVYNGYIYYTNGSDRHALYRMKTDGTGRKLLCNMDAGPLPINIVGGFIYYNQLFIKPD